MTLTEAKQIYPHEELHNYRIIWQHKNGSISGKATTYAPDREEAIKHWERQYPSREIGQVEEQW